MYVGLFRMNYGFLSDIWFQNYEIPLICLMESFCRIRRSKRSVVNNDRGVPNRRWVSIQSDIPYYPDIDAEAQYGRGPYDRDRRGNRVGSGKGIKVAQGTHEILGYGGKDLPVHGIKYPREIAMQILEGRKILDIRKEDFGKHAQVPFGLPYAKRWEETEETFQQTFLVKLQFMEHDFWQI